MTKSICCGAPSASKATKNGGYLVCAKCGEEFVEKTSMAMPDNEWWCEERLNEITIKAVANALTHGRTERIGKNASYITVELKNAIRDLLAEAERRERERLRKEVEGMWKEPNKMESARVENGEWKYEAQTDYSAFGWNAALDSVLKLLEI